MQVPSEDEQKDLKRRKLIATETWTTFHLSKGPEFSLEKKEQAIVLTAEMLQECVSVCSRSAWSQATKLLSTDLLASQTFIWWHVLSERIWSHV